MEKIIGGFLFKTSETGSTLVEDLSGNVIGDFTTLKAAFDFLLLLEATEKNIQALEG